jgi:dihydroflavonol-4-reductase
LRQRGDEVVALARDSGKARRLTAAGCDVVVGDLADRSLLLSAMSECQAGIHAAAVFEVGVPADERVRLTEANIAGTRNVLSAAIESRLERLVYVSTVAVFGNTRGSVADESSPLVDQAITHYEWTKALAHRVVRRAMKGGLPAVIVLPSTVYGPGDSSQLGQIMRQFLAGKAPAMLFPDTAGFSLAHVDDVTTGILLALDRGEVGEEYILGGEITTMRAFMRQVAELAGMAVPERAVPPFLLRRVLPRMPGLAQKLGFPPNANEAVAGLDGYTYWASDAKAARELGYQHRSLREGLRRTLIAEGRRTTHEERDIDSEPALVAGGSRS